MGTVSSESPKVQYSVQREQSDGSLNRISVRVPYFSKDDIHVYVDDVEIHSTAIEGSKYTWRWDGDYISITPNVASGEEVLVRRITPIDEAIHIFDGRSEFDDQSMDENFQQLIYIAQEYSEGSGIKDVFSDINMHGYKIRNVGWATDDDDIVTYGQYKVDAEGARVARDEAKQHAQNALQYKQDTQGIATQAVADVATAKNNAIAEVQASVAPEIDKAQAHANTAVSAKDRCEVILTNVQSLETSAGASASASAKSRDEAKTIRDEAQAIKDELKTGLDTVQEVAEPIKIVANNIDHVVTTSTNINDVNIVSADLEGSSFNAVFQDYGDLDDTSGSSITITGGNIKTVADNITHVRIDSENIEDIKTVANAMDNLPTISATLGNAVRQAESARDTAQASATEATNQANIAKQQATVVTAEGSTQVENVQTAGATAVQNVENASTQKITDAQNSAVNAVKAQQNISVQAVITQQGSSIEAVIAEGDKQVSRVTDAGTNAVGIVSDAETAAVQSVQTEGTKQVNLAKAQATLATTEAQKASSSASSASASATEAKGYTDSMQASVDACSASETASRQYASQAEKHTTNASSSASSSASSATASANSAKAAKASEDNAASHKASASASASEATKQAERARNYADQMAIGQVLSDWTETDPTSKAFILHKPTLGKLSAKDSIAYSEITDTPPQPDLTPYAKTDDVNTALSGKANATHTHAQGDITGLANALNGKANTKHTHAESDITGLTDALASKANQSDVDTKFQSVNTALGTKLNKSVFEGFVDYGDLD